MGRLQFEVPRNLPGKLPLLATYPVPFPIEPRHSLPDYMIRGIKLRPFPKIDGIANTSIRKAPASKFAI